MTWWGPHPELRKVLALGSYDPGGVLGRFVEAADKLGSVVIRSAHRSEAYFRYARDLEWSPANQGLIRQLASEADLLHLNNTRVPLDGLGIGPKPALLHHHGSDFRRAPQPYLRLAATRRWVTAVSTIDLLRYAPGLRWLPTAYDVERLAAFGRLRRRAPDGRIRVVSAPTKRPIKSTAALISAVRILRAEGLPIDLKLVEHKTWAECMALKASADIYFDQVILGYGCNAVESWAMGIPVIAGADEWTIERMRAETGGVPFYRADETSIAAALRALAGSADLRAECAGRGFDYVRRFHAERPAVERLEEAYEAAVRVFGSYRASAPKPRPAPPPGDGAVVFRSPLPHLSVTFNGRAIRFIGGMAVIHNQQLVGRLRNFALAEPKYQITED